MYTHHKQSLDKFVESLQSDPNLLAVITAGSIAKGTAKETSDIDVYLLVTDQDFEERKKTYALAYTTHEFCNYEDGYIDVKIINMRFWSWPPRKAASQLALLLQVHRLSTPSFQD